MAYLSELPDVTQPQAGLMLNRAGGFVHKISDFARFKRFLILGADCNTYYATAKVLSGDSVHSSSTVSFMILI